MAIEEKGKLKQCTVVLTRGCNLRCDFCFVKEADYRASDQLSYEELKRIVDLCGEAGMKYLFFTGGEPLTYPHIIDILRYVSERHPSITPTIATNGVLLENMELCRCLVDNGLKYLDISMKGADKAGWERATGYDGFAKQLRAISNLASLPVEFTCSMVITPDSVTGVCDAVQAAYDKGGRQFSFTFFIDNIESESKDREYLEKHNPFELIEAFTSQIERLSSITDDWWVEYSYPLCVYTERQLQMLEGRLAGPCQIHLQNAITVNTRMELLPCDMYISTKLGRLGKEFSSHKELESWMQSPVFRTTMDEISRWPSNGCSSCKHLRMCYGGCPVLWKNYSFEALMELKADMTAKHRRHRLA